MVYTLIKTDAFGNILWERTFSGDSACSVQQTRDGGYIAAGYGRDSGAYLIKTDASGNLVWEKVLGNSNTIAYCVQQTKDGGYILTGRTWGAESDVYLAKLSPDVSGGPRTFYVDDDAPNDPGPGDPSVSDPLENGTEIHPFDTIQEAIDAATSGDNVLVAQGTYREKVIMKDGVDLQGAGAEVTIIDSYRSFAVVTGANNCRLDGFTITGYADDDIDGVYCKDVEDFVISNNIIKNNTWSGVYALRSSVTISNNLILDNVCAGVWCVQESPVPSTIVNNTILGNADEADVALWYSASAVAVNNIVGDIDHWGSTVILVRNNILYQDFGGTNISTDPIFADPNKGDYHLKSQAGRWDANSASWVKDDVTSLCIDAGDPASPIGLEPFPNGGIINMGAYGGTVEASKSYFGKLPCETIMSGDINGDCIVNLKDFAIMTFHWLEEH